jgi:ParB/RepB/Spo0J family partition protein
MNELLVKEISLENILSRPRQPRSEFDQGELASLAESIREHGVLQPLIVSPAPEHGRYILVAGERRLRAARMAGLSTAPAVVREVSEQERLELALIENVQRADLNPVEVARAYQLLSDEFGLSHKQIAERVGKNRSTVSNTLRLLKLPDEVQGALLSGTISERQAAALLGLYELPTPLRDRAERGATLELRPSGIARRTLGGAPSDLLREAIGRLVTTYAPPLSWAVNVEYAVPLERPSRCADCPNLIKRGADNLCGDGDPVAGCFQVRLVAYQRQRLPIPAMQPAPQSAQQAEPAEAEVEAPNMDKPVEAEWDAAPAHLAHKTAVETQEEAVAPIAVVEAPEPTTGSAVTVTSIPEIVPEPINGHETGQRISTDKRISTPAPAAAPMPAVVPTPKLDWRHSTIVMTVTLMPEDDNVAGRPAMVGLRANNGIPLMRMCREHNLSLSGLLLDLLAELWHKHEEASHG